MSAGITATFSSTEADAFTVGNAASTGQTVAAFSGKYLAPGAGGGLTRERTEQRLSGDGALREALEGNGCTVLADPATLDEVRAFAPDVVVAHLSFATDADLQAPENRPLAEALDRFWGGGKGDVS